MKIIKVLSLICFLWIGVLAQNSARIEGKVIQNSEPIPGFLNANSKESVQNKTVSLVSKSNNKTVAETKTDDDGNFIFENVADGDYFITVECKSCWRPQINAVTVVAGQTLKPKIELNDISVRESVTISADMPQSIDEVSKTVNVIDNEEITNRNEFSLVDSLRTIPGFRVQQLGGFGKTANIKTRGLRNQDTAVLLDGIRFRDASSIAGDASAFLSDFTLTSVDRLEVLRGSGSSLYGTNAIGGTIDFLTPRPSNGFHGSLLGELGGLGLKRTRGNFSVGNDTIGFNFGVSRTVFSEGIDGEDDAKNTGFQSRIEYNPFKQTNISARFYISGADVRLNSSPDTIGTLPASTATIVDAVPLSTSELNRYANGTPTSQLNIGNATFIPDTNDPDNFQKSRFFNGQIVLTQVVSDKLLFQTFYQGLKTSRDYTNGVLGIGFQPFGGDENYFYDGQIHTFGANLSWSQISNNQVKLGYEYEWEKFGNDGVFASSADNFSIRARQASNTFFVQDLLSLFKKRLQISGAFRAQWFSLETPDIGSANLPARFTSADSPPASYTGDGSISYFFDRTKTKLRAHVGNGYRVPSLYERFSFSYFFGTYFFSGNPDLKPERSIAFDGGLDQTFFKSRARISATAFYTEIKDEIAYLPTDDFSAAAYFNFDKHFSRGAEISADIAPTGRTRIFASYTFTNSDVRNFRRQSLLPSNVFSQDKKANGIPDHQFTLVATGRIKRLALSFDFLATSDYLAPIFSNTTFGTYTYRFKGERRADLTAAYEFPAVKDKLRFRLFGTIENLFGDEYFENGFRTIGRAARGGLSVSF
ncbi:MAG TPA: TonB-dependent receptor [Pyrinomonadaceae bacterium]|jgi:iron complex outermembrane receptor protein